MELIYLRCGNFRKLKLSKITLIQIYFAFTWHYNHLQQILTLNLKYKSDTMVCNKRDLPNV